MKEIKWRELEGIDQVLGGGGKFSLRFQYDQWCAAVSALLPEQKWAAPDNILNQWMCSISMMHTCTLKHNLYCLVVAVLWCLWNDWITSAQLGLQWCLCYKNLKTQTSQIQHPLLKDWTACRNNFCSLLLSFCPLWQEHQWACEKPCVWVLCSCVAQTLNRGVESLKPLIFP